MNAWAKLLIVFVLSIFIGGCATHISANVPDEQDFDRILQQDLNSHFIEIFKKDVTVKYELLRRQPTQSGVAAPKYYVWVSVYDGEALLGQGAARLAAVDKIHFLVTDFVTKDSIISDPSMVGQIFPAKLCTGIIARANK